MTAHCRHPRARSRRRHPRSAAVRSRCLPLERRRDRARREGAGHGPGDLSSPSSSATIPIRRGWRFRVRLARHRLGHAGLWRLAAARRGLDCGARRGAIAVSRSARRRVPARHRRQCAGFHEPAAISATSSPRGSGPLIAARPCPASRRASASRPRAGRTPGSSARARSRRPHRGARRRAAARSCRRSSGRRAPGARTLPRSESRRLTR
jgi:hypothetical protein